MASYRSVSMDDDELYAFLGREGTGVLSFARDDESYSLPVSYGFDDGNERFYIRLGFGTDSEKARFKDATARVSFVVYSHTDEGWKSVVARGRLEEVTEAAVDGDLVRALRKSDIPLVTIFDQPLRELDFQLHRLVVDELTGRKEAQTDEDESDIVG